MTEERIIMLLEELYGLLNSNEVPIRFNWHNNLRVIQEEIEKMGLRK